MSVDKITVHKSARVTEPPHGFARDELTRLLFAVRRKNYRCMTGWLNSGLTFTPRVYHPSVGRPRQVGQSRFNSADQYVLATGAWSKPLSHMLRLRVPVLPGKGYAIIVEPFSPKPSARRTFSTDCLMQLLGVVRLF